MTWTIEERDCATAVKMAARKYLNGEHTPDWEQRRYEITKDLVCTGLRNAALLDEPLSREKVYGEMIPKAIDAAEEIVRQLRERRLP